MAHSSHHHQALQFHHSAIITAEVDEKSAVVNHAQLVGEYDGTIHVITYNWSEFFEGLTIQTTMKGITQMHHFRFSAEHPSVVFVKNASDNLKECKINLLKSTTWRPSPTNLPEQQACV